MLIAYLLSWYFVGLDAPLSPNCCPLRIKIPEPGFISTEKYACENYLFEDPTRTALSKFCQEGTETLQMKKVVSQWFQGHPSRQRDDAQPSHHLVVPSVIGQK
jgi:hypothetical protein